MTEAFLACMALLLAGCATTGPTPPTSVGPTTEPASTPAMAPVMAPTPASVRGCEETSTMLDNFTVHVAAVDGVPLTAGREGWNTASPLPPGPRQLTLVFTRGVFSARADVTLVAVSGANYEARFATDAQLFGRNSFCEFWLIDSATREPVTTRVRVPLVRTTPETNAP
jgi:hypothetical protein